jgi:hypothetical protein
MTPNTELTEDVETKKKEALKNKQERPYHSFSESINSFYQSFSGIDSNENSNSPRNSAQSLDDMRPEYVEHI